MFSAEIPKTKNIANRRIVEQIIGRLKQFNLLGNEVPITSLHLLDDVCWYVQFMASEQ